MVQLKGIMQIFKLRKQEKHLFCTEHLKTGERTTKTEQEHVFTTVYIKVLTWLYTHVQIVTYDLFRQMIMQA